MTCAQRSPTNGVSANGVSALRRAQVARWYVDADTLGLAHCLVAARHDVTFCGDDGKRRKARHELLPSPIQDTETDDEVWIPLVTQVGLAILTRDIHIEMRTSEKAVVKACAARMFAITSAGNLHNWELLEVVVPRWRDMETAAAEPGPYIYSVTKSGLHKLDLE